MRKMAALVLAATLTVAGLAAAAVGARLESKTKEIPFEGMRLGGWPTLTVVSGRVVVRNGQVVAEPPCGSFLRPTV